MQNENERLTVARRATQKPLHVDQTNWPSVQLTGVLPVLRRVIAAAREVTGASAAALLLYDAELNTYVPTVPSVAEGLDEGWLQRRGLPGVQEIAWRADKVGETVLIADTALEPDLDLPLLQGSHRPGAVCASPLQANASHLGVLVVFFAEPQTHGRDIAISPGLAALAESAIFTARAHEREQSLRSRFEALDQASKALTAELSLDEVLLRIVELAAQLVGARYGALGVVGADGYLEDFIVTGITSEERVRIGRLPRGHGLLGALIREGQSILVPNIASDPRRIGFPRHHPPMSTLLGVPIQVRDTIVGDLYLTDRADGAPFSEDDQHLVELLAAHAGIAIDNARLHLQEQDARRTLQHALESLRASEQRFSQAFHSNPIASAIIRPQDDVLTDVNAAFLAMTGYDREHIVGRTMQGIGLYADPADALRLSALRAESAAASSVDIGIRTRSGTVRDTLLSLETVQMGDELRLLASLVDITLRKRAEDALRFLTEADMVLASSLDYTDTLANVARRAVPVLSDWCSVIVIDDDGDTHRVAVAHSEPDKENLVADLYGRYKVDLRPESALGAAMRRQETQVMEVVSEADVAAMAVDKQHLVLLKKLGISSMLRVPMASHGETLGMISLVMAGSGRHYAEADIALAEDLARRAALAVSNARLHTKVEDMTTLRERERISRDLHDGIIQDLYGTALQLESLAEDTQEVATREHLLTLVDAVSSVIGDIRTYIQALRARELLGKSLQQGLASLVHEINGRNGLDAIFVREGESLVLQDSAANSLLQITRECLSNVIKHSQATRATVHLHYGVAELTLAISDNGRGFDPDLPRSSRHHGLANLQARAAELGGTAQIASALGSGTAVTVRIPLAGHRAADLHFVNA